MTIDVPKQGRIEMSQRERDVLKVMYAVPQGQRSQAEAARPLGLSVRQVRRIQRKLEQGGDGAIVHGPRGKPSNHQPDATLKRKVRRAYRKRYQDFGPTFASQKLADDGLTVSPRTLRRWLIEAGLWKRQRRRVRVTELMHVAQAVPREEGVALIDAPHVNERQLRPLLGDGLAEF